MKTGSGKKTRLRSGTARWENHTYSGHIGVLFYTGLPAALPARIAAPDCGWFGCIVAGFAGVPDTAVPFFLSMQVV